MADIGAFADEGFDAKAWVNTTCSQKPNDEALEKFLAEMEMRLQLAAEEIEASLQESSSQAMRRIPFAVQEIYRLQGDIQGMQDEVKVLASHVGQEATEAAEAVAYIRELDSVKANMEAACSTLKEATELSGMFIKVEDVFASGDLPRVAELLKSMRASLALVGDVPEFRAGRGKLRALEDRLQSQVEGALQTALSTPTSQDSNLGGEVDTEAEAHTRSLCGLLLAVDRYSTIESLYLDTRLARVHALWEELSAPQKAGSASVAQWLPPFFNRLLPLLKDEVGWAGRVLPAHKTALTRALFFAVFHKVSKGLITRLSDRSVTIPTLITLSGDITHFGSSMLDLLPAGLPEQDQKDLLAALLEPLEDAVTRYPKLESHVLEAELNSLKASTQGNMEGDALVRHLWESVRTLAASCCAAVDRCMSLTGGSELPGLSAVLDKTLTAMLAHLLSLTSKVTAAAAGGGPGGPGGPGQQQPAPGHNSMDESNEELSTALRLVVLAGEVVGTSLLRRVDAALRSAVNTVAPRIDAALPPHADTASTTPATPSHQHDSHGKGLGGAAGAHGSGAAAKHTVDPLAMRLVRNADRLHKLQRLVNNMSDPRYNPLPQATHQADALSKSTQTAALDALLTRVRAALAALPSLPQWTKPSSSSSNGGLPTFSVEPLAYVTSIGDYLMMLPQQLEVLFGDELMSSSMTQDDQDELAAQWLDRVVVGASSAYVDAISQLTELSTQGGVQLAADVEYFNNVMSALHVAPPPSLLTLQLFAGIPDAEYLDAAKAAVTEGGGDAATLRLLLTLRKLPGQL